MCRRWNGHFGSYAGARLESFALIEARGLRWFRSSDTAERGFCTECGSSLFWRPASGEGIGVCTGTLDSPTGLRTLRHEHVASKGDYYEIGDHLEQRNRD
jgi:hypothetical protein